MNTGPVMLAVGALVLGTWLGWQWPDTPRRAETDGPHPTKSTKHRETSSVRSQARDVQARFQRILAMDPPNERLRALVRLANGTPEPVLARWVADGFPKSGDPLQDEVIKLIIVDRLQRSDPGTALKLAARDRGLALDARMGPWMAEDPDAVEHFLLGPMTPRTRRALAKVALADWARSDPDRAIRLLGGLVSRVEPGTLGSWKNELIPLAETHRNDIVEASRDWPPIWRQRTQKLVLEVGWKNDLSGTLAWMKEMGIESEVFSTIVVDNANHSESLLAHLDLLPKGWLELATQRGSYAVVRADPVGWLQADAGATGLSPALLEKLQCAAAGQLQGQADPRDLMAGAIPSVQAALAVRSVNTTFYRDKEGTRQWVESLEDPEVKAAALARLTQIDSPSAGGTGLWGSGPFSEEDRNPPDPNETPAERREREMRQLIGKGSHSNTPSPKLGEALKYVLEAAPESRGDGTQGQADLTRKVIAHAARWAEAHPAAAAAWAEDLPADPAREWALRNVARQWTGQAPAEARAWVQSLPEPSDRSILLEELR